MPSIVTGAFAFLILSLNLSFFFCPNDMPHSGSNNRNKNRRFGNTDIQAKY
jgi:hypothetical protein